MTDYILNLITFICINGVLAVTLNFILGYAGIFSLAHAAFFGVGAYVAANIGLHFTQSFLLSAVCSIIACSVLSIFLALPTLRVRGEYFVAVSLGVQIMAISIFSEWHWATGGLGGLVGIPRATFLGMELRSAVSMTLLAFSCLCLVTGLVFILVRSSFGRNLTAVRDSESAALAFGKRIAGLKLLSVAISSGLAGLAGALYAYYIRFVNTESFTLDASVLMMAMVIIGGTGTIFGPLLGAFLITVLPPLLSYVPGLPAQHIGSMQQIFYGLAMIVLMVLQPGGLVAIIKRKGSKNA